MRRLDLTPDYTLLAGVLRDPARLARFTPQEFSRAVDAAYTARLLGWFLAEASSRGAPTAPPDWLRDRLASAHAHAREYERAIGWEIDRLRRVFLGSGVPWVLLKGAGYVAAALTPGRGRRVADIDVLVPQADLSKVEQLLLEHGWGFVPLDAYDERYYREWMHELPPMVHGERRAVVDVHHAILPRTSRLHPLSARLLERSVETADGVRVLCPAHMVLHAAAHLFHDGEIAGAIRDLVDLDELLRPFGPNEPFWQDLAEEADALELTRPAYYSLRYANRWLGTPIPDEVKRKMSKWAPPAVTEFLMDAFVDRTLVGVSGGTSSVGVFALYVRSHWLRMPPFQLARHLARKSLGTSRRSANK